AVPRGVAVKNETRQNGGLVVSPNVGDGEGSENSEDQVDDDDQPTNERVGPGKKAHGFRVELGGDVGFDSRSDDANYDDDKIVNEEAPIGFVKSDDDDVWQKDNNRKDEEVFVESIKGLDSSLEEFAREVQKWKDVGKDDHQSTRY
ncbi:hypothetical protein Tco_1299760, partial [Tanacetum coccineum]